MTGFSQPTQRSSMQPCPPHRRPFPGRLVLPLLVQRLSGQNAVRASSRTRPFRCQRLSARPSLLLLGLRIPSSTRIFLGRSLHRCSAPLFISSNLAVSRSLGRGRSHASSSSPLVDPSALGSSRAGRPHGKRSASSSCSGGRKRFRGGKGSAPSSKPLGFRKWEPSPYLTLSGGCLSLHCQAWRDRDADPWVVEVLREGYRIPFLSQPTLSAEPIPMPSYNPLSTKGVALGEVTQALIAKGTVELAPLPSPGFYSRLFVVWKTSGSWRLVIDLSTLNRFVDMSHFQMETIPSVLLSVRQGSHPSGISPLPLLCSTWPCLSVHSAVLWPLHGPTGFHPGHGSCFRHSPFMGYSHASIPRRLAGPVVLPRVSPPGPSGGAGPMSGVGHCHQPGEIQPQVLSGCSVSRGGDQCPNFGGFSIARTHRQASINSWRISVLRRSSRQYLALAAGHAVLDVSSRPWRSAPHLVPTAVSPPVLGSGGPVNPDSLVLGLSSGSAVVAPLAPTWISGPTPRPSAGGHTWGITPLQASGAKTKFRYPSKPRNF